jgi:hypothetical protein
LLIYSSRPSNGARELAYALGIKQAGRRVVRKYTGTVINWGSLNLPDRFSGSRVLNKPEAIELTSDKREFFRHLGSDEEAEKLIPRWSEYDGPPTDWIAEGKRVVCRRVLAGSGGIGIVIADRDRPLVPAPLYVEYIPKDSEWRVHVFRMGKGPTVVDYQKKARRSDVPSEDANWEIRNLANGFIYKRHDINPPKAVLEVACKAMEHVALDFGACDIIWNERRGKAYLLEINSAPGLEGTTVSKYAEAMKEMLNL